MIRNQPASQMEGLDALAEAVLGLCLSRGFAQLPQATASRRCEAMGVAQHHDAASGTAKQHVTFDYAKRLAKGRPGRRCVAATLQFPFASEGSCSSRRVCGLKTAHASPRLFRSFASTQSSATTFFRILKALAARSKDFVFCDLRNVSVCAPTQAVGKTTQRREQSRKPGAGVPFAFPFFELS